MSRHSQIEEVLSIGDINLAAQFTWGSNHTYLVDVSSQNGPVRAVYKPSDGERPLWDFPLGTLAMREVAAYLVSEALGWRLVPPTVLRPDGPAGGGSLQLFLEVDPDRTYFALGDDDRQRLRPVAVFDLLINNADRKGGHVFLIEDGDVRLIDHGVCFHEEDKLRTVIWDFAGEPIPKDLLQALAELRAQLADGGPLNAKLTPLLSRTERSELRKRNKQLLSHPVFPPQGSYPWPLV